jgi:2-polyprenyl-3-methyl-5-hydroxy-6-metoxy-1,4-benzoquinol methylase
VNAVDFPETCPVCARTAFAARQFGLRRCVGCGFVVDEAIFRRGSAEALNESAFGDSYEPETSFWVRRFDSWKCRRYLANLRRFGVESGTLLEVGVGRGTFLRAARAAGFSVTGCDRSAAICRRVNESSGIPIHCADLESLPLRSFDVVAMHHVVEHVHDPIGFLRAARQRLREGGVLHVAVPNVDCWEARLAGWTSYEPYHLAYFNADTMTRAMSAAGLHVIDLRTHESFSGWFLAVLRSLRPQRMGSASSGPAGRSLPRRLLEHPYRVAMVGAGALTWPGRALQARLGRGDELIVMART